MAQGPIFGIKSSPVINTEVVQLLAGLGRSLSSTFRAAAQQEQEAKKMKAKQELDNANMKLREENLKLQQEKFELDKQSEARLQKESESRITARSERSARADRNARTTELNTRLRAINIALSATQKAAGSGAIEALNKNLAANVPLVEGPEDSHLLEFEGMTPQRLAVVHNQAKLAFETKVGDALFAADNPGGIEVLRARMELTGEALGKRIQQFGVLAESTGHQVAPDASVRANLNNLLQVQIGRILGELSPEPAPTGEEAEDQAAGKATVQPPQAPGAGAAAPEPTAMPAGADLSTRFEAAHKGNDRASVAQLRQQFITLDRESARRVFEELSAQVGADQAEVLLFGSK